MVLLEAYEFLLDEDSASVGVVMGRQVLNVLASVPLVPSFAFDLETLPSVGAEQEQHDEPLES